MTAAVAAAVAAAVVVAVAGSHLAMFGVDVLIPARQVLVQVSLQSCEVGSGEKEGEMKAKGPPLISGAQVWPFLLPLRDCFHLLLSGQVRTERGQR